MPFLGNTVLSSGGENCILAFSEVAEAKQGICTTWMLQECNGLSQATTVSAQEVTEASCFCRLPYRKRWVSARGREQIS